MAMERKALPHH